MVKNSKYSLKNSDPELCASLRKEFWNAHDDTLFNKLTISAVRHCSVSLLNLEYLKGTGIKPFKVKKCVLYKKSDVLEWLDNKNNINNVPRITL